jgi:hypothetical protein
MLVYKLLSTFRRMLCDSKEFRVPPRSCVVTDEVVEVKKVGVTAKRFTDVLKIQN